MRPHVIFRYSGLALLFNASFLAISAVLSAVHSDAALYPLLYSSFIAWMFGAFPMIFVPPVTDITSKEGLVIVVSSWLASCVIGAMPYVLWGGEFSLTNAWFESVSGFTTTGSTILTDVEALPIGLLFWRSATHWIGGIGIIVFVLAVLPSMGKTGMILYRTELSSLARDNFHQRSRETVRILCVVYVGLTLAETVALLFCGMGVFDAVTHSFATIATGGFSPRNLSIAEFDSVAVETVIMIFMILSGMHFGLLFSAVRGKAARLWKDPFIQYYLAALCLGIGITAIDVHGGRIYGWAESLRYAAFQVISIGTSTGFATADTTLWPSLSQLVIIFFTLQCACAGSTSGGIKVDRILISWKALAKRIQIAKHPRAVVAPKIRGVSIDEDAIESATVYVLLYIGIVFLSSLLLTSLGVDSLTAFSGSAATMGNVGPGFGSVGSLDNFAFIPSAGKWILTATMLLGRLEVYGLLLLLMLRTWR